MCKMCFGGAGAEETNHPDQVTVQRFVIPPIRTRFRFPPRGFRLPRPRSSRTPPPPPHTLSSSKGTQPGH